MEAGRVDSESMNRVVSCHDWIVDPRGAERVLVELASGWDRLEINTLFLDSANLHPSLQELTVFASTLNRLPGITRHYRYTLPFFRRAALSLPVRNADLVVSISHSVAKAFPRRPGIPHVCYCLTPMRYLWEPHLYGSELNDSFRGLALSYLARSLKSWDQETSGSVDHFVAISKTVPKRIERVYGRNSALVYPCSDLGFYTPNSDRRDGFFLVVSGLVPQKRLDLAVEALNRRGDRLLVVGTGPLSRVLQKRALSNIEFVGWQSDEDIRQLYRKARAVIFPGLEDFGLVPVEALACGCPVIAFGEGGATEVVEDGSTGILFPEQTVPSLLEALERFDSIRFRPEGLRQSVQRFSRSHFRQSLAGVLCKGGPGASEPLDRQSRLIEEPAGTGVVPARFPGDHQGRPLYATQNPEPITHLRWVARKARRSAASSICIEVGFPEP